MFQGDLINGLKLVKIKYTLKGYKINKNFTLLLILFLQFDFLLRIIFF